MLIASKNILKKLEKENLKDYWLFYQFYFSPSQILNSQNEEIDEKETIPNSMKELLKNPYFLSFLTTCMNDPKFLSKLTKELIIILKDLSFDLIIFKQDYIADLEEEELIAICNNEAFINEYYRQKYTVIELFRIVKHYKKYKTFYDLKLQPKDLNESLLIKLSNSLNVFEFYYDIHLKPFAKKEGILDLIRFNNYDIPSTCYLETHDGHDQESFLTLVCEQEFLNIIEEILLTKDLSQTIMNNILEILEISINFKTLKTFSYENFMAHYSNLEKEKIKKFNLQKAIYLKKKIQKKNRPISLVQKKSDHE